MRIGFVRDTRFTNEPRGQNIGRALLEAGHEVFVLCYGEKTTIEDYEGMVLNRFYINPTVKRKFSSLVETIPLYKYIWARRIREFIRRNRIEVLQVHDLYMLGAAEKANSRSNLPVVANFHENYPAAVKTYNWARSLKGRLLARPDRWATREGTYLKNVRKTLVTCEPYRQKLLEKHSFLKPEDIVVYMNVPNLDEFSGYTIKEDVLESEDAFILFYFGVNAERRGLFIALEALRLLIPEIPDVRLLLIGPLDKADKPRFQEYLDDPELNERIIFYPWREIAEIPSYIKASNICLSPLLDNEHHQTTIANKIFQYMLYEKPMVVSDCEPQIRIAEDDHCGLVHRADSPRDLADKIQQLHADPALCQKFGKKGRQAVLEKYNTRIQARGVVEAYAAIEKEIQETT